MWVRTRSSAFSLISLAVLSACGGGGDDPAAREDALGRPTYSVGGTITGVVSPPFGDSITLGLFGNFVEGFPSASSGSFTFVRRLLSGDTYNVSVAATVPGYNCSVASGGSGTIARSNVTDIVVACVEIPRYDVPVSVSGLPKGTSVVIQNNFSNTNRITASADGLYTFPFRQFEGTPYFVSIATPPAKGSCVVQLPADGTVAANLQPTAVVCGPGK